MHHLRRLTRCSITRCSITRCSISRFHSLTVSCLTIRLTDLVSSQSYSRLFSHKFESVSQRRTCTNCLKYTSRSSAVVSSGVVSSAVVSSAVVLKSRNLPGEDAVLYKSNVRQYHKTNTVSVSPNGFIKGREPLRVLFFGTDPFSVRVLQILNDYRKSNGQNVIGKLDVLSNVGETKVRQYATSAGLRVLDWPVPDLTGHYNIGVLASFGHLIPSRVISMFDQGILNVHPSLLPRWRGAAPIVHTILSGDSTAGVTIMRLRPKHFDTGPVLSQKEVIVPDNVTSFQLRELLAEQGGQLLVGTLQSECDASEQEQSETGVTYAHKVPTSMAYVNWATEMCEDVHRHYRAFGEFLPLRSEVKGQTVKLLGLQRVDKEASSDCPGTLVFDKGRQLLCVRCQDGWLGFKEIVIKKTMTAQEFYNGYISKMADWKMFLSSVSNGLDTETYRRRILQRR